MSYSPFVPSEAQLKSHNTLFLPNYHFCGAGCFPSRKGETLVAVRKGIAHNYVDFASFILVEVRVIFIPMDNSEVLLSAVCKPPSRA
jgi:hypothetical protein